MERRKSKWSTLIDVVSIEGNEPDIFVNVDIPNWNGENAEIPLDVFPKKLRDKIKPMSALLAEVNIAAQTSDQLNPRKIQLLPDYFSANIADYEID